MLRTLLRRAGAVTLAVAAALTTLTLAAAPASAATPPKFSCPGPERVGGTAPAYSSVVAAVLRQYPGRCGQRLQAYANYGLRRDTWEPRRKVLLGDGRAAFEYQQYSENQRNDGTWTPRTTDGTVRVLIGLRCVSGRSVNRAFDGNRLGTNYAPAFTVQFTNLTACFNGASVYFRDEPQTRLYVGTGLQSSLQAACGGVSRTAIDPNNANRLTSVFATCNGLFVNPEAAVRAEARVDRTGGSEFTIPGSLNIGINLGPLGSIATPQGVSPSRYWTFRLNADGCYVVSGVGNTASTCF